MATQPRLAPRRPPAGATPPLPHPADRRWQLLRLLLVAAVTGSVVAVWGLALRDTDDQPATAGPARITSPTPEVRRTGAAAPNTATAGPAITLRPDALPRPPEPVEPPLPARFERFVVQPGDTVYDISVAYDVSIDEILLFNPDLGDGSRVDVGQVVVIPIFEP